jgi:hypothetical protein
MRQDREELLFCTHRYRTTPRTENGRKNRSYLVEETPVYMRDNLKWIKIKLQLALSAIYGTRIFITLFASVST